MCDEKLYELMAEYDRAPIGSDARRELGAKLDDAAKNMKESHIWRHARNYADLQKRLCTKR